MWQSAAQGVAFIFGLGSRTLSHLFQCTDWFHWFVRQHTLHRMLIAYYLTLRLIWTHCWYDDLHSVRVISMIVRLCQSRGRGLPRPDAGPSAAAGGSLADADCAAAGRLRPTSAGLRPRLEP